MMYDKDKRLDEDDNDLWDDELDLLSESAATHDHDDSDWTESSDFSPSETDDDGHGYADEQDDYYSEPEPEPEPKPHRTRFFSNQENDDDTNDFYNSDSEPEPKPVKKPKAPKLDPEDPDYWLEEESGLSGILPKPRKKWKWWLAGILVLIGLLLGIWIWFFRPYADGGIKYGYIMNMERRGSIVKTFEGTMIPYKEIGDPDPLYFEQLAFSVDGDSLAALMKRMMLNCVPVRVEYEIYHAALPWKGESPIIIIKADSADTSKILPPEYRR